MTTESQQPASSARGSMEPPTASSSSPVQPPTRSSPLSGMVQGTAQELLHQMEENLGGQSAGIMDERELLQMSEPGPLGEEGRDVEDVLNIISQSIFREGAGHLLMRLSDRTSLLSVVSHSLSAYITTLEPAPLQRLSARLVKMVRIALYKHYPKMATDGYECLFSKPPVIYLTSNTYLDTIQFVCRQLGLPLSTIQLLKIAPNEVGAAAEKSIEKSIEDDKAAGKLPIFCVANVHSALNQNVDVCGFEGICRRQGVWLHLEGNALAGLVLLNDSNNKKPVPTGDSMALTLGSWIGVPAVPFVTLYKLIGSEVAATDAGLTTLTPAVRLNCLPLWCVLRSLGEKQLRDRIFKIFNMLEFLNTKLSQFTFLRVLSQRLQSEKFVPVSEVSKGNFDVSKIYRTVNPALAFQYVSDTPPDSNTRVPVYFNNLNSWLGQTMQRDCGQIPLEIVDVETTGYVLRLCPFESLSFSGVSLNQDDLNGFIESVQNQSDILNATVVQRQKFMKLISEEIRLEPVEIANWAGLGGVRYIPSEYVDKLEALKQQESDANEEANEEDRMVDAEQVRKNLQNSKDEKKKLIDHRNIQLVQQLRSTDSAFSLGEGPDGRICIRFGMVSMETDVEELLALVIKTGITLDQQLAQLKNMSEVIQKGIEQAQGEIQRESDEAIWQEGILRHVPLVGSLYNWISPLQRLQVKGRTLSLQEGKLDTSDKIFKARDSQEKLIVNPQETEETEVKEGILEEALNEDIEDAKEVQELGDDAAQKCASEPKEKNLSEAKV
ncbi:hypothetical protein TCAL_01984 [Tigriopus californicus]|uniref:Pyridoxal-dependent decarboxylase domain-containing protein 1 n=1 Tax=Tigriopus californicus TaxID=6832 RepID=A0A553PPV7_TIGCA|nr:hypothetical protein TCAL_01984 [Tigriopus californicus]|eukprot:TCALIF_01984-PA protein Name:"Similar to Pdxdc1 Pyridoxal-dependent decarboxylase domain-containing protein 1 (Mus musculus)" AED:0.08 eAED:0.08 QI:37/0.90/0.83/1/0.90/1/12/240/776